MFTRNHAIQGRNWAAGLVCILLSNLASIPAIAAPGETPITASRFGISIDGVQIASFSELQGITTQVDVLEDANGQDVPVSKGVVVLLRGLTEDSAIWEWQDAVRRDGDAARLAAELVAFDRENKPVARFYLENAWPSKINLSPFRNGNQSVMTEEVTLVCEYIQRVAIR